MEAAFDSITNRTNSIYATIHFMQHLFSPWRIKYIQQHARPAGCIFCLALEQSDSPENLIVRRTGRALVMLNRYPYNNGHVMVVPISHQPSFELVDPATRAEMMELMTQALTVLRSLYHPDGFNVGANLGAVAGAGVADHVHLHIVPRWGGDTNFMGVVGQTRVLPEDLSETYARIRAAWQTS